MERLLRDQPQSVVLSWLAAKSLSTRKLGGAGDRFGDHLAVSCANVPSLSECNQFTDTKFTRPVTKISKSIHEPSVKRTVESELNGL